MLHGITPSDKNLSGKEALADPRDQLRAEMLATLARQVMGRGRAAESCLINSHWLSASASPKEFAAEKGLFVIFHNRNQTL